MWTKYTYEHPALTGVYGMLPGDGVDLPTFKRTLEKVSKEWQFNRIWGWDFPMLAMAAARTGQPALAIDMLMHPSAGFQFDEHGLATGGPFPISFQRSVADGSRHDVRRLGRLGG